mgnify:CR=1 FL=1
MKKSIVGRLSTLILVCTATLAGFYASLVYSATALVNEESVVTFEAIQLLEDKGFTEDARWLRRFVVFRSNDNWLNASVEKENAFAATNFPFGIITLYPDFFDLPADKVERAAILLHEAQHVKGDDEKAAYEFVWKNRKKLGWTAEQYGASELWRIVQKQTKDYAPMLFICDFNPNGDCTADPRDPIGNSSLRRN